VDTWSRVRAINHRLCVWLRHGRRCAFFRSELPTSAEPFFATKLFEIALLRRTQRELGFITVVTARGGSDPGAHPACRLLQTRSLSRSHHPRLCHSPPFA
jgi:hypothetical protein